MGLGDCRIHNVLPGEDLRATIRVLASLGVSVQNLEPQHEIASEPSLASGWEILVEGRGPDGLRSPVSSLDCMNSGTTMRVVAGVLAGRPFTSVLDGDQSLRLRPMERIADPLRQMGAGIATNEGRPPLTIQGTALSGVEHELPIASAQIKTALLLAGTQAAGITSVIEPARSRDHTERLLASLGVPIEISGNRCSIKSINIQNDKAISIPGDISSAAFLLVAAAILPGSELTVTDVGLNPTRIGFLAFLRDYGAVVSVEDVTTVNGEPRGTIRVVSSDRRPLAIDASKVPGAIDEITLVAVLGAFADGTTRVTKAQELRVKESDRIATIGNGLKAMGADFVEHPDGFEVHGGPPLRGESVSSAGDHRIAMGLAVAALGAEGSTDIEEWECVAVSYPGFGEALARIVEPGRLA